MISSDELTRDQIVKELQRCSVDPWYFAVNYAKTLHKTLGIQRFPAWEFLRTYFMALAFNRKIVLLKSRQMFITWSTVVYVIWDAIFNGAGDILFISKRQKEAYELIDRSKTVYNNLPRWMQPRMTRDSMEVIVFGNLDSRIFSVPNNPNAVRTYSPRMIVWDEMPHTPYDREILEGVMPVIEQDGRFVGIGTPNGPFTEHARLYLNEDNDFTKLKFHYSEHPEKGQEWVDSVKKDYSDESWGREQELDLSSGSKLVYEKFSKDNILSTFPDYFRSCRLFRSFDFGFHSPVCLWHLITDDGKIITFAEWFGEDMSVQQMARAVLAIDKGFGICEDDIEMSYGDPSGEADNDCGYSAVDRLKMEIPGFKFSSRRSNIMPGVDMVRTMIRSASGVVNYFVYKTGDPLFVSSSDHGCSHLVSDFRAYPMSEKDFNMPIKNGIVDHGMDTVRYFIIGIYGLGEFNKMCFVTPQVVGA